MEQSSAIDTTLASKEELQGLKAKYLEYIEYLKGEIRVAEARRQELEQRLARIQTCRIDAERAEELIMYKKVMTATFLNFDSDGSSDELEDLEEGPSISKETIPTTA